MGSLAGSRPRSVGYAMLRSPAARVLPARSEPQGQGAPARRDRNPRNATRDKENRETNRILAERIAEAITQQNQTGTTRTRAVPPKETPAPNSSSSSNTERKQRPISSQMERSLLPQNEPPILAHANNNGANVDSAEKDANAQTKMKNGDTQHNTVQNHFAFYSLIVFLFVVIFKLM